MTSAELMAIRDRATNAVRPHVEGTGVGVVVLIVGPTDGAIQWQAGFLCIQRTAVPALFQGVLDTWAHATGGESPS